MANDKDKKIKTENKNDRLSQQELKQVSGGITEPGSNMGKNSGPSPWSPDEEPGNGGNL